jgi:cysteine desulfurase
MAIYLDYNASAPIDERVIDVMMDVYRNDIGNADSRTHEFGDNARKLVENARAQVASILSINKDEVFFTSGATESNNIVIQGLREYGEENKKKHIVTTAIEHKAVLESSKSMEKHGFEVDYVKPDKSGRVSAEDIIRKVRDDTLLVCVMHVNNETGIIQPIKEIGDYLEDKDTFFHIDATQSFGKLVEELKTVKYDTMAMSAHKICGPQGIGALVLRKRHYRLPPVKNIMYGGQQERGIRPGTIPVALVAGLGKACEIAEKEYSSTEKHNIALKKRLMELLEESGLQYSLNGDQEYCVNSTANICLGGVSSEALMLASKQYCGVSNGSACNSNSYKLSYVLEAMGIDAESIRNSIRISWGLKTDRQDFEDQIIELINVARDLAL